MSTYESMPAAPEPVPGIPAQAPSTVRNAVLLMYLRAALGVVGIIVSIATKNSLRDHIHSQHPDYDTSKLNSIINASIAIGVVIGIIFLVFYIFLATQVAKGKNWARIVTWVLSALGVLAVFGAFANTTALTKIVDVVSGLTAIAIIILLAMAPSNQYFAQQS